MSLKASSRIGILVFGVLFLVADSQSIMAFEIGGRWTTTASHGSTPLGSPITLTWGLVGDGTNISGEGPSGVIAALDSAFGAGPGGTDFTQRPWFPQLESAFTRWGDLSGVSYVYEPNDDGATHSITNNRGILGVRADIRIAGAFVDGPSNVLAFNFLPNNGDMVLDTADAGSWASAGGNFRFFRNLIAHEHGHGLGFFHIESSNTFHLMEPFLQTTTDGPQIDEIQGAHRLYGDFFEKSNNGQGNDTASLATPFGLIGDGQTASIGTDALNARIANPAEFDFVSIDDNSDTDYFSFEIDTASEVNLTLTPRGPSYNVGPQGGNQSVFDSSAQSNLTLALVDSNGTTVLESANLGGLGDTETISSFSLPNAGEYFARITGTANTVQLYELDVAVTNVATAIDGDFNNDDVYDCADIDALVGDIASGGANPADFDLTGDGTVDGADLEAWLAEAGAVNLDSGNPYLEGDANLNGVVDVADFNIWNTNKFTTTPEWCGGDFNADGGVDASDFNIWNANRFLSADHGAASAVPEPSSFGMMMLLACGLLGLRRRARA